MRRIISLGLLAATGVMCSCGMPVMVFAKASVSSAEEVRTGAHVEIAARVGQRPAQAIVPWSDFHKRSGE